MTLALSYCHQFIYHHTRRNGGLLGQSSISVPLNFIPFVHLKSHLQRLFDFSWFDVMQDPMPILWALFILACHEQMDAVRVSRHPSLPQANATSWAVPRFWEILQRLPPEDRNSDMVKSMFAQYLYDESLNLFLTAMFL